MITDLSTCLISTCFHFRYEDGVIMEVIVEKFVKYFRSIFHHNNKYFFQFLLCEAANLVLIYFNFWATDQFLQVSQESMCQEHPHLKPVANMLLKVRFRELFRQFKGVSR